MPKPITHKLTKRQEEKARALTRVLDKQTFRDFYEGIFTEWLEDSESVNEEKMLEELYALFRRAM